jgi:hypothetical protein
VIEERRFDGLRPYDGNGARPNNGGSTAVSPALVKVLADMVEHALARDAGRLVGEEVESAQKAEELEL